MNECKLSIVIPMYNVEQYIERCIRSLENQDIDKHEYEILVIDDGSPDNSSKIVNKLQNEFTNIIMYHKQNGGLSSARNYGIKHANGKYIWFVDSDDYIEKNVLANLLTKIYSNNLDLLGFDVFDINGENEKSGFYGRKQPTNIISGLEYIRDYNIGIGACYFISKKEIFLKNNIYFIEGIIHEDYDIILRLYEFIQRMSFVYLRVYNYVHREGSITTIRTSNQILKSIHSWQTIISLENQYFNRSDLYALYAKKWINDHKYLGIHKLFFNVLPITDKRREFKIFKRLNAFQIGENHLTHRDKLYVKILRISWLYFILIHIFRSK